MEREFKNTNFFELPDSFEDEVIERIKKIRKRRKRKKIIVLPAILIVILSLGALIIIDFKYEKRQIDGETLTMVKTSEQKIPENIYIEVIPIKNFEKENHYLIEFVSENEEKIYAF